MANTKAKSDLLSCLLGLSHDLGQEDRKLAILGEGNTSARVSSERFLVKASGSSLRTLSARQVAECRPDKLLSLLETEGAEDQHVDQTLMESLVPPSAMKPSIEAIFHAWLLTLPGVNFVGHTHPVEVNRILCTAHAAEFASHRLCPDEIVCCRAKFVLVPYCDPGLGLARAIRDAVNAYMTSEGLPPRVILLQNHGLIALGGTPESVLASTLMAVKAAEIYIGAVALGTPRFLSQAEAARIESRSDEHYREKVLGLR